jgi:serine/threonine protein kinase
MGLPGLLLILIGGVAAIALAVVLVIYVLVPVLKAIGWAIRHLFRFVAGEIGDALRLVGAIITGVVFIPMVVLNIIIGRWSASAHYGRAIQGEIKAGIASIYRIIVGHPARLLCLQSLTEGIEKRVPEAMAAAPGRDKPAKRAGQFDGYTIVGSLAGGGSGGRLYVAEPDTLKRAALERSGHTDVDQVVIKAFSLQDGSSLPQIVRESRALDAAKKMGLVLEHELTDERFHYVMQYVPGESLGLVTQRLHAESGGAGLGDRQVKQAMSYAADIVRTLDAYHRGGLWHKDVKPDNIIVDGKQAHLVDLGLITPLRSAMTLTTHGTEYFRDPELVRLALKGVKVHQVDGARFDIYAIGAVLYSVIENSFPAHGGLSQLTRRCPEALKWIVRRSMTDYDKRYRSAAEMLADLGVLLNAEDPFKVRPGALPSMSGEPVTFDEPEPVVVQAAEVRPTPPRPTIDRPFETESERRRPKIRMADWFTGRYVVDGAPARKRESVVIEAGLRGRRPYVNINRAAAARAGARGYTTPPPRRAQAGHPLGLSAKEQVERARSRAHEARNRAHQRMSGRHARKQQSFSNDINIGGAVALFLFLAACVGLAAMLFVNGRYERGVTVEGPSFAGDVNHETTIDDEFDTPLLEDLEGRVLVIKEGDISELGVDAVRSLFAKIKDRGAEVVGALVDRPDDEADNREINKLVAEADYRRELAPIGSDDARNRLVAWLTDTDAADVLVYVHDADDDADHPEYWVVARDADDDDARRIQRLIDAIPRM